MGRIDEKTLLPLSWVLGGFATIISITMIGAFWVSTVSYRLERIEDKLGIPPYRAAIKFPKIDMEKVASASEKSVNND